MTIFGRLIPRWVVIAVGIAAIAAVCILLAYCTGRHDGKSGLQHQIDNANIKAQDTNLNAIANSTEDRSISDAQLLEKKKELIDAVNKTPDTLPSATRIAVGCERLRRQGTDTTTIPVCNGR